MTKKFKIPLRKINTSDCVIHVGQKIRDGKIVEIGEPVKIHENEWVQVLPILSIKESMALGLFKQSTDEIELANAMNSMCESLSQRIVDWNWTDMEGELLEKPHKNSNVFKELTNEELIYLLSATLGETPGEQKNELSLAQDTSLTTQAN